MSSEEEQKEQRHYCTASETKVLQQYIEKFFSFPERSDERTQVVTEVTSLLSEINDRWTRRSVRLWFNNNRKQRKVDPMLHLQTNNNDSIEASFPKPPIEQGMYHNIGSSHIMHMSAGNSPAPAIDTLSPFKKRIPRPMSVTSSPKIPRAPSPGVQLDNHLLHLLNLSEYSCPDDQKMVEEEITSFLIKSYNDEWVKQIGENDNAIVFHPAMPSATKSPQYAVKRDNYYEVENKKYDEIIECAVADVDGIPAIVAYDIIKQSHILYFGNHEIDLKCSSSVNGIVYDGDTQSFYICYPKTVKKVSTSDFSDKVFGHRFPACRSSVIASSDGYLLHGSGNTITTISKDEVSGDFSNITNTIATDLHNITCMSATSNFAHVASRDHHSFYMYDLTRQLVSIFSGCFGGINCIDSEHPYSVTGSDDFIARVFDTRVNQSVIELKRHTNNLSLVRKFDNIVITGGHDNNVRLWDLRMTRVTFDIKIGAGVPISAYYDSTKKELAVVTGEKCGTSALGFDLMRYDTQIDHTNNGQNLYVRYSLD